MSEKPYDSCSPAAAWAEQSTKHALDQLFNATYAYRSSQEFYDFIKFVTKFHFYSLFNAFLIHIQRPGAKFVAPLNRWQSKYGRKVKPGANPIAILQPRGPVMFVFDVSDTEEGPYARPLPKRVVDPFDVKSGKIGNQLPKTEENAKRDGIAIHDQKTGAQRAGSIRVVDGTNAPKLIYKYGKDREGNKKQYEIMVRYVLLVSGGLSPESRYATLVHELAHLYCGHIGTPNPEWWPDRTGLSKSVVEFEAETVSYLVCSRIGIKTRSEVYLSGYIKDHEKVPKISLECIMKAAGIIEKMGQKRQKPRKESEE